ncbi:hypothetical protein Q3G72_032173 [Acer saccharum]|nr:hypothetical protein Q3G72_032173 [Acer saccharum]
MILKRNQIPLVKKRRKRKGSAVPLVLCHPNPIIVPSEAGHGEGVRASNEEGENVDEKSLATTLAPLTTFRIHRPKGSSSFDEEAEKEGGLEALVGNEVVSPSCLATSIIATSHGVLEAVPDTSVISAFGDQRARVNPTLMSKDQPSTLVRGANLNESFMANSVRV